MKQIVSFGKWILAGEHAVLRGVPALVFPWGGGRFALSFDEKIDELSMEFGGSRGEELKLVAWGVVEQALKRLNVPLKNLHGRILIESEIPIGAGLGASAALCVAVGRWCINQGYLDSGDLYEFSRHLEDLFHGESSGVDISVAISGQPIRFVRGQKPENFTPRWMPRLYLSYSGQRGVTSECVAKVKSLHAKDPELGARLDERMRAAVELSSKSLLTAQSEQSMGQLAEAMQMANSCFQAWGLSEGKVGEHLSWLSSQGAMAVKPTGSGGGGYILSLWRDTPPKTAHGLLPI